MTGRGGTGLLGRAARRFLGGSAHPCSPHLPPRPGFDPLSLGTEPAQLSWFVQAELQHARWAMLGVAGILVPEIMGGLSPPTTNYDWFTAGAQTYNIATPTLFGIQFFLMLWVEMRRLQDIKAPGSASQVRAAERKRWGERERFGAGRRVGGRA